MSKWGYRSVHKEGKDSFVVNKSEFIGHCKPCITQEEAIDFIEKIKSEYPDARHNCYAYIVGEKMEIQRYSDDGEPSGTGGVPILSVIKKENLTNICVVVTRYFGGVLLGAGGLIRAYTKGASISIDNGLIVEKIPYYKTNVTIDYTYLGIIENQLQLLEYTILEKNYLEQVSLFIYVAMDDMENFKAMIMDKTGGNCNVTCINTVHLSVRDNRIII